MHQRTKLVLACQPSTFELPFTIFTLRQKSHVSLQISTWGRVIDWNWDYLFVLALVGDAKASDVAWGVETEKETFGESDGRTAEEKHTHRFSIQEWHTWHPVLQPWWKVTHGLDNSWLSVLYMYGDDWICLKVLIIIILSELWPPGVVRHSVPLVMMMITPLRWGLRKMMTMNMMRERNLVPPMSCMLAPPKNSATTAGITEMGKYTGTR